MGFFYYKLALNSRSVSNYVHLEKNSNTGIATVILQKPKVNSLDVKFLKDVTNCFLDLEKNDEVKGVLIKTKFHGKVFSAGLDIKGLQNAVGFPTIKIGLTEAQMGIPVEMLNLLQFHGSNSKRFSEYSLLTGPVHTADTAFKYGMLDEIVPLEHIEKASQKKLVELTTVPLVSYSQTKLLMRQQIIKRIEETKEAGIKKFVNTVQSNVVQNIV